MREVEGRVAVLPGLAPSIIKETEKVRTTKLSWDWVPFDTHLLRPLILGKRVDNFQSLGFTSEVPEKSDPIPQILSSEVIPLPLF